MIEIKCVRGAGDKELNTIEDSLIISDLMAVSRGKYEIDKQWYLTHQQTIEVPHKKTDGGNALMDGDIIEVSDARFGIVGNRLVQKITILGTPSEVKNNVSLVKFEEFV